MTGSGVAGMTCSVMTPREGDTISDGARELRPADNTNRPGQFAIGRHGQRDMIASNVINLRAAP
jgi:hypothetical protein